MHRKYHGTVKYDGTVKYYGTVKYHGTVKYYGTVKYMHTGMLIISTLHLPGFNILEVLDISLETESACDKYNSLQQFVIIITRQKHIIFT